MTVLGLEVSTSSVKCVLFSAEEGIVDAVTLRFDASVSDTATCDPQGVLDLVKQAVQALSAKRQREIAAIGLGGAWHSLLLLDERRRPLGPNYTWADVSASPTVELVKQDEQFVKHVYSRTGCMAHALYPIWKCHHFRRTQPELMQRARYVSSLIEYLFEQLTGEAAVSKCIASGSGFLDIHTLDWHDELLELVHLERDQFAELKDGPHWAGLRASIAGELGLQPGIPVTVGFSDGAMNQVGIGGDEQGTMSFSVGTSGAIRTIASQPLIPETPSTWCYYLYNGKRLVGAATQGAGNCVDWFAGNLPEGAGGYQALERAAEEIDVEQAPFFLPFIYGERSPGWQDQRLGGFLDVRPQHGVGDFYHALVEGILFNIYHCYTILSGLVGEPKEILISGGIMHSQLWLQMAADIFQRVLLTTGVKDDSIIGMSVVALQALVQLKEGEYKPRTAVAANPQRGKRQAYQERFQRYLELYELNR